MRLESTDEVFPFGEPVRAVTWPHRGRKPVIIVGVHPSAAHARWAGADGKQRVRALAVANEPHPFWTGEGDESMVAQVAARVPTRIGTLRPAKLNGVSGKALDDLLGHLGLRRDTVYVIDLWNRYLANKAQQAAVERERQRALRAGEREVADLLSATRWTVRTGRSRPYPRAEILRLSTNSIRSRHRG